MSNTSKQENRFLIDHLKHQPKQDGSPEVFKKLRNDGAEQVQKLSFPNKKDEAWRFISLRDLYRDEYIPAASLDGEVSIPDLEEYYFPECKNARLVFINGTYSEMHSSTEGLPAEVTAGTLQGLAEADHPEVEKHLNRYADFEDDVFTSFNNAFINDGAFVHVPEGIRVDVPVQLLFVQTDARVPYFTTSRCLVIAEQSSELTLIEDHVGTAGNKYFNLPVMEVNLEEEAYVKHTKIQRDSREAIHIGRTGAHVNRHANYESYTITLGARLSRNEPRITQMAEEVNFTVDGLVMIDGEQVSDTHSVMDHRYGHAESHQLHKCVINDRAHAVFNGKIFVRKDAQKIDSFQENRNLLLSRKGQVNTKPQLEIFADDVKCSHGATVGQLEPDEVFYLKSRGLKEQQARELLTYAFALETIENITVESVKELLIEEVHNYTDRQMTTQPVA